MPRLLKAVIALLLIGLSIVSFLLLIFEVNTVKQTLFFSVFILSLTIGLGILLYSMYRGEK